MLNLLTLCGGTSIMKMSKSRFIVYIDPTKWEKGEQ